MPCLEGSVNIIAQTGDYCCSFIYSLRKYLLNANDVLGALRATAGTENIRSNSASGNIHGDPGHLSGTSQQGQLTLPQGLEEKQPQRRQDQDTESQDWGRCPGRGQ